MFLNLFYRGQALPLRERRMWRKPRCNAKPASEANNRAPIGASCDAHFGANSNATPSATFAANRSAAVMPNLI
jgi:hypothetical protein